MGIDQIFSIIGPETILILVLIGALLELDVYFIGMSLISQPIVAGGVAGYILGDASTGIMIGAVVQLIWLNPPVGAYVPPSSSAIAFVTTVLGIVLKNNLSGGETSSILMYSMISGIAVGYFVGQMDIWTRKLNTKILHLFEKKLL